jgi:DNA-binding HxlR family transcriptional regulator
MLAMGRPWIMDYDSANCAIGAAVDIIGERPTFLVLREAFNGVRRFDDMRRRTGMPRQVLSDRLARLVHEDLLRKVPYQDAGQRTRHEYRLTGKGLDLYPVLVALMEWGDRHALGSAGPQVMLRHRDCGEPVRLQLACEARHILESAREVTPVPGPGARKTA